MILQLFEFLSGALPLTVGYFGPTDAFETLMGVFRARLRGWGEEAPEPEQPPDEQDGDADGAGDGGDGGDGGEVGEGPTAQRGGRDADEAWRSQGTTSAR